MVEKITLDMLTQDSVSYKKEFIQEINGVMETVGKPWRRAYINSSQGRIDMQNEIADPYKSAILSVWGSTPTVTEE
jgi:hypothetical protein